MADVITKEDTKMRVRSYLPSWFKAEPGFRFLWDGSEAVVIGWGGWRDVKPGGSITISRVVKEGKAIRNMVDVHGIADITFEPPSLVFSYLYKGEHHLNSVDHLIAGGEFHDSFRPLPGQLDDPQGVVQALLNHERAHADKKRDNIHQAIKRLAKATRFVFPDGREVGKDLDGSWKAFWKGKGGVTTRLGEYDTQEEAMDAAEAYKPPTDLIVWEP